MLYEGAAPLTMASLPLLPIPSLAFSSSKSPPSRRAWRSPPIRELATGARGRSVRTMRGDNDVVAEGEESAKKYQEEEPALLRMGVSFVTETLRLFSNSGSSQEVEPSRAVVEDQDVLQALREDYERAYFLTGDFTGALYADDCLFADPTIQFRGRDKYQRNLKLLVPFFENPKLTLFDIQEEDLKLDQERSINAKWNLSTYLRLPWKPLIDVDGSTLYVMDANSKIVKHIESWSISGREAVQQLFVPSDRAFFRKQSNL